MSKIDYQALREIAKQATQGEWVAFISSGTGTYAVHTPGDKRCEDVIKWTGFDGQNNAENNARYIAAFNPEVVQALLDERERNQQYIKSRDQENEDIALTVGKLRVELEAAKKRIAELKAEPVSQTYKLNQLSGNSPVTQDSWISCSERMPVIGELNWRTSFPLLITCEIGVIPAYYGFVSVNGNKHYGFMESLKYGDDNGNHPQTNEYGLISNVTHWMPLPEPPQEAK
ncbi:TPA: ead/Ea22-like family protein [Escherichia coli]|nr:ead/Ea22-like family protein [Escherichia coli]MCA7153565.1 ead/Ea22-like family protein [Escherichia coli]HCO6898990.1 ead/Ea22-like family protein [Escherichia coli]HCO9069041.1 ead/Ea22-like family protein [Escherichia coli]HCO9295639.1 ead/Ea22-like family protein [Escherichia coli]